MKRYIKVKNRWRDTLEDQKKGIIYFVIKRKVLKWDSKGERRIGHLQAETDTLTNEILKGAY